VLGAVEQEPLTQRQARGDRQRITIARWVHDGECTSSVADDLFERRAGKPYVERQRDRAGAHRAEEEFDELSAISDQHGDALAAPHPEPRQHARYAIHAPVELPVCGAALKTAEQINDGYLVREPLYRFVEEKTKISPPVVHGSCLMSR